MILSEDLIVSTIEVKGDLLKHEMGHVEQAQELGLLYLPFYLGGFIYSAIKHRTVDLLTIHRNHLLEVDANERAGLPPGWGH